MPDPNKPHAVEVATRPAPRLDEVRRLLGRYRRADTSRPRGARRTAGPGVLTSPGRNRAL
jgi:hypothetical protein